MLRDGRLHLSGIAILQGHLTEENRETLLGRAAYKSKRQIQELVAEVAPKPDVPSTMRRLPVRREKIEPAPVLKLRPEGVRTPSPAPAPVRSAVVEPLAPSKYKIQFTASAELRDKLERLRALVRSSVPDGDLATIIEEAVTEKLERLESKRFGKTKAPRKSLKETDTSPSSRYIPAAVKRAVYDRDQGQCRFVGDNGRRCKERSRLEFHHRNPYGRGGGHKVDNVQLLCRTHNRYLAERDYGKKIMECYRRSAGRVSEPAAFYDTDNRGGNLLGLKSQRFRGAFFATKGETFAKAPKSRSQCSTSSP
jgi:hypothetical protein